MLKNIKSKLGSFLIILAITIFTSYHLGVFVLNQNEKMLVTNYFNTAVKDITITNQNETNEDSYIGVLEIPKINLEKGFYSINNIHNTINKNIEVLKNSSMPNNSNSILAIAAHSGNGKNAYFTNLDKLDINDLIYIYFDNYKYTYEVKDIHNTIKDGNIEVDKNNETVLVLTTCNEKDKTKQLVVTALMISKKNYS